MKKTRTILGVTAIAVLVIGGGIFAMQKTDVSSSASTAAPVTSTSQESTAASSDKATGSTAYTAAEVAQHNSAASCWTSISGNVYDVTKWIGQHPGGEGPILGLCGKDGTSAFEGQHGSNRRANSVLATFMIGTLTQ